jgi:photosystem II stability/assembly factor-like uncharacterized protein
MRVRRIGSGRPAPVLATAFALASLVATAARPASANGRYPSAQQLVTDPSDPTRLWLRATYGLLTSADSGKTWSWICESAVGYNAGEDPMLVVASDGTVLAASFEGLLVTHDHGCNWSQHPDLGNRIVDDAAIAGDASHILAISTRVERTGAFDLVLFRSDDAGASFHAVGTVATDVLAFTVDAAASDPSRVYVTGLGGHGPKPVADGGADAGHRAEAGTADAGVPHPGLLLRSRDGGRSWDRVRIPGLSADDEPYIAAVHPTKPDTLYVRVKGASEPHQFVESWLLYTEDGGDTWRELFRGSADMLGFALVDGGDSVVVGLGDAHDASGERPSDPAATGVYRAVAPAFEFARLRQGQVGCLSPSSAGLYVCGSHATEGYELGLSSDDGQTVSPVFDFGPALEGPPACSGTSSAATCTSGWPYLCDQLGACGASATDAGPARAAHVRGGCGCGSPARTPPSPATGTARLDGTSTLAELLVSIATLVAALLRRFLA